MRWNYTPEADQIRPLLFEPTGFSSEPGGQVLLLLRERESLAFTM